MGSCLRGDGGAALRSTPKFKKNEIKKINKVIPQKVNQHTTDAAAAKVSWARRGWSINGLTFETMGKIMRNPW